MKCAICANFIAAVAVLFSAYAASADVIINVDSLLPAGIEHSFGPGTYQVTPIGIADGGLYNAWNGKFAITGGCDGEGKNCFDGWTDKYEVSGSFGISFSASAEGPFLTDLLALAHALPTIFTIHATENIRFRVVDNPGDYPDNVGGMSFRVIQVPAPPALVLALGGLASLLLLRRAVRRRGAIVT